MEPRAVEGSEDAAAAATVAPSGDRLVAFDDRSTKGERKVVAVVVELAVKDTDHDSMDQGTGFAKVCFHFPEREIRGAVLVLSAVVAMIVGLEWEDRQMCVEVADCCRELGGKPNFGTGTPLC